jgi:hypothetical protein
MLRCAFRQPKSATLSPANSPGCCAALSNSLRAPAARLRIARETPRRNIGLRLAAGRACEVSTSTAAALLAFQGTCLRG